MIIYLLTNTLNNKRYVGQTNRPWHDRWSEHIYDARVKRYPSRLHGAISKYGKDVFKCKILCTLFTVEETDAMEQFLISAWKTCDRNIGYNITHGGGGHMGKMSPESLAKLSARKMGNKNCVGRVMSLETRRKISRSLKGRPGPNLGKTPSPETRKKIGDAKRIHPDRKQYMKDYMRQYYLAHRTSTKPMNRRCALSASIPA